jgi:hypothetical protein
MSRVNGTEIYFSHEEICDALKNFNKEYKDGNIKEKIEYRLWQKLKKSVYGVTVENSFDREGREVLDFFEVQRKHITRSDGTEETKYFTELSDWIGAFDIYGSEFGWFFYDNYFLKHSDLNPDTIYDDWEAYGSMRDIYASNACSCSSGNQTLNNEEIKYWDCNNLTVGTTTGKTQTIQSSDYVLSADTNTVNVYGEPIATKNYVDKSVKEAIDEIANKYNEKEKDSMKGFNFNFGPCTGDNIKMSVYGLAIQNTNGEWVSYDTKSGQIMNVDLLNFDGRKFMFKMPVAIKDIAKGDIVIHNKVPMFVLGVVDDGVIAVDVRAGEEKKILPTNSPFGFNFVTKVVSMFSAFDNTPSPDTPFGNFLPFMLMGDNKEIDPMMIMMMMQNGNTSNMFNNPMMMYFLCGDKMKDNMLPLMMMMNQPIGNSKPSGK